VDEVDAGAFVEGDDAFVVAVLEETLVGGVAEAGPNAAR
jgi:hypothetical protein